MSKRPRTCACRKRGKSRTTVQGNRWCGKRGMTGRKGPAYRGEVGMAETTSSPLRGSYPCCPEEERRRKRVRAMATVPLRPVSEAERRLIEANLSLIHEALWRMFPQGNSDTLFRRGLLMEDLFQECALTLLRHIDRYDPQRGAYSTWANLYIHRTASEQRKPPALTTVSLADRQYNLRARPEPPTEELERIARGLEALPAPARHLLHER